MIGRIITASTIAAVAMLRPLETTGSRKKGRKPNHRATAS